MPSHHSKSGRNSHTNRYGETFFVHARPTRAGKRYFMGKRKLGSLAALPVGYEIHEDVNGKVSVLLSRRRAITEFEEEAVHAALRKIRRSCYKANVRERYITIYASAGDCRSHANSLDADFTEGFATALENLFARKYGEDLAKFFREKRKAREGPSRSQYYPLLRFALSNKRLRRFSIQRIYFTGDSDWLHLEEMSLPSAVMKYVPHLGKNSFFDLL